MVMKRDEQACEDVYISQDEGWWNSVLADEGIYSGPGDGNNHRLEGRAPMQQVDWEFLHQLYEKDEIICLHVYGYNRGGLLIEGNGLQGFVPISHLIQVPANLVEEERRACLASYVGRALRIKVIECEPESERAVFSERAAMAGEGKRKQLFRSLKTGDIVNGVVTNVTDFGVFIDLGGLEGLIHVSELSWGRVQNPGDLLKIGQEVDAMVLQASEESGRVALSIKRLMSNPWISISDRRKPGDVVTAQITGISRYGAFARLEEGIEGLIHISSMKLAPGQADISRIVRPGQNVSVRILHIDAEKRRLGLSLCTNE